jgi:hypothetical protein
VYDHKCGKHHTDVSTEDYAIFSSSSFDANEYANAVLAGEPYPGTKPPATSTPTTFQAPPKTPVAPTSTGHEDLSVALAKLNFGIDDVSKQLRAVVRQPVIPATPPYNRHYTQRL